MKTKEKLTLLQMSSLLRVVSSREAASLKGGDGSGQPANCVFEAITFAYNYFEVCGPMVVDDTYTDYINQYSTEEFDEAIINGMTGSRANEFSSNFFNTQAFTSQYDLINFLGAGDSIAMVSLNQGSSGHAVIAVGFDFQRNELMYRDPENNPEEVRKTSIANVDLEMMFGLTGCKGYSDPNQ